MGVGRIFTKPNSAPAINNQKVVLACLSNIIFDKAKCIHMLGLKMGYTGDVTIIDCVEVLTNEVVDVGQWYIPELLKLLKDKYS